MHTKPSPEREDWGKRMVISRRELLTASLALTASCAAPRDTLHPLPEEKRKRIATIITEYRFNSHADVIVGRLLAGYEYNGEKRQPLVRVVSMYTDQLPVNDLSRSMAAQYGVPIIPTVSEALTLGAKALAVDGVVLVGEHGNYPLNEKGQRLYPRFELFEQIVDVFRETGRSAPVFCDKHLSWDWGRAKQMYDWSLEFKFPLMAGSSLPLAWRLPPLELNPESPVDHAVVTFYGDTEAYGFHALESLQCMVERRRGGETGIAAVQCLSGDPVWAWTDANPWAENLLGAALARSPENTPGSPRKNAPQPVLFILEYRSGLRAAVYLLNGHTKTCGFAADLSGKPEPVSTQIWLQPGRPYSHFSNLVYAIERMMVTGKTPYPVERTLLTTGALSALMDSRWRKGARLETPHLAVAYRTPRESQFNRGPVAPLEKG